MVGSVVEGARPRQTTAAKPTSTEASTLLWSRMIIFTVSQNCKKEQADKRRAAGLAGQEATPEGLLPATPPVSPLPPYLVGLQADRGAVAAVGDEVLAVVPEQAVRRGSHQLLGTAGGLLAAQQAVLEEPVHVVDQDAAAVGEVLHRVHADAGRLGDDAQDEALVGHHPLDLPPVVGEGGQDVGHQVCHAVLAQVDAEVDEEGARHLQQVAPLQAPGAGRRRGWCRCRRRLPPVGVGVGAGGGQRPEVCEEQQLLQQQRGRLRHRLLHGRPAAGHLGAAERAPAPGPAFLGCRARRGGAATGASPQGQRRAEGGERGETAPPGPGGAALVEPRGKSCPQSRGGAALCIHSPPSAPAPRCG